MQCANLRFKKSNVKNCNCADFITASKTEWHWSDCYCKVAWFGDADTLWLAEFQLLFKVSFLLSFFLISDDCSLLYWDIEDNIKHNQAVSSTTDFNKVFCMMYTDIKAIINTLKSYLIHNKPVIWFVCTINCNSSNILSTGQKKMLIHCWFQ